MASLIKRPDSSLYQIQYYVSGKIHRISTGTPSLQIAKDKLRQFESARVREEDSPFPSRTPKGPSLKASWSARRRKSNPPWHRFTRSSCSAERLRQLTWTIGP